VPLHVVVVGATGQAFHTIRTGSPTLGWAPWAPLPALPGPVNRIDSAVVGGELHVCAVTFPAQTLLHTFRDNTGTWQSFWGNVGNAAGLPSSSNAFDYTGLAGAGTTLHVFTTANPRPTGGITPAFVQPVFHAIRSTGPGASWLSSFNEVNSGQFDTEDTAFKELTCTNVAGNVHMCTLGLAANQLWHTIQLSPPPAESWQPYSDVKPVLTNSPQSVDQVSVAGVGSNLHVCIISGGSIFHTIRMSVPPSWQNPEGSGRAEWGDVSAVVPGLGPGSPNFIDCAGVDGNLHICCITTTGALLHTIRMSTPPSWQNPEGSGRAFWGTVSIPGGINPAPFKLVTAAGQ
jgi:hypothetical protein